ncbi:hypothetical protein KQH56_01415 [bacterium]|nr:hypothetical protein [bacterium]
MSRMINLVLPLLILLSGACLVYVIARMFKLSNRNEALLTTVILATALVFQIILSRKTLSLQTNPGAYFGIAESGGILMLPNAKGGFISSIALFIGVLITLYASDYLAGESRYVLFYPLVLLLLAGLMALFLTVNLFTLFLITELITVTASALVAFRQEKAIAIKAGYKYLIMSSLGTMIMLLGVYFVFRATDNLNVFRVMAAPNNLTRIGAACFLLGFSIKAGVFPLHTWVPDVYGYASPSVSALLAGVVSKSMLFVMPPICLRLGMASGELGFILLVLACFNMIVGVVKMLGSRHLGRFLSYSSISQTGYLMFTLGIGFYYNLEQALSAALFLFLSIALMKSQAFLSAGIFERSLGTQDLARLVGVQKVLPLPSYGFSVALAGLAGIPLLAGFTGKWLAFTAAVATGDLFAFMCLAVFMLSTLVSLAGYLPVLVRQFIPGKDNAEKSPGEFGAKNISPGMLAPVIVLSGLVLILGVYPGPWIAWIGQVVEWMAL